LYLPTTCLYNDTIINKKFLLQLSDGFSLL
jgi:hypothetical protein